MTIICIMLGIVLAPVIGFALITWLMRRPVKPGEDPRFPDEEA